MDGVSTTLKTVFVSLALGLSALIIVGLIWFFFLGPATPVGFGWYLFSFAAGLTMIVLPCTLPLAFVIVPLSMGKGAAKGFGIAVAFGLGVAITLSMYGVIAAVVGEVAIGTLGAPLETVKNWLYFGAGLFAYLFALGEIGLWKFRMPSYTGAAPAFIQKQSDYLKALLLGLFLGNIGVGCPHPATPVILTRIAASGDVFYGWMLFFVHAIGRILPLLLLALLAVMGVNALKWLVARKDKVERATGWGMVFVAGFILVLGLFTHDWWVYSGQHTLLESITREEQFIGLVAQKIGVAPPHAHGIPTGTGLLDLPLWLGNWVLVGLWILPLWWYHSKKSQAGLLRHPERSEGSLSTTNGSTVRDPSGATRSQDDGMKSITRLRFWFFLTLSILIALTVIWVLPDRFLNHTHHPGDEKHEERVEGIAPMHADEHGQTPLHEEGAIREGLTINLNVTPVPLYTNVAERLDFFVNTRPGNRPVSPSGLELDHARFMHVIGVRDDLNGFFHLHPQPTGAPGIFSVSHTFGEPGRYKVWSEVKKDGVAHMVGHPEMSVAGPGSVSQKDVSFGRNVIVGDYQVALRLDEPAVKGRENELAFDVHTPTGREVEVEEFLGAEMHLAVIKDGWTQFLHIHPDESNGHKETLSIIKPVLAHGPEEDAGPPSMSGGDDIHFRVTFPEAGLYKMFAQFRPEGVNLSSDDALLATYWVKVEEKSPAAFPEWWRNLLVSGAAIILLSFGVKKYLAVKQG